MLKKAAGAAYARRYLANDNDHSDFIIILNSYIYIDVYNHFHFSHHVLFRRWCCFWRRFSRSIELCCHSRGLLSIQKKKKNHQKFIKFKILFSRHQPFSSVVTIDTPFQRQFVNNIAATALRHVVLATAFAPYEKILLHSLHFQTVLCVIDSSGWQRRVGCVRRNESSARTSGERRSSDFDWGYEVYFWKILFSSSFLLVNLSFIVWE